jgi:aryl-alcohol dehydrogenase-like predicted oxidoreductase
MAARGGQVDRMEYRNLGRSGIKVSCLALGTMTFGETDERSFMHEVGCDEATAFAIMDRAFAAGVNVFDTADIYGRDGAAEAVVGRWLAERGRREQVVVASKFRFASTPGPNREGCSRLHVMRAVEASLRRLRTDRIDLYQVHAQDVTTPEDETLRALDDLVRQGKVLYVGCSNYTAYRLLDALWHGRTEGLSRYVSAQLQYSLVTRDIEREHVPLCLEHGVGVMAWSPLARGFLTGKFRAGQAAPAGTRLERRGERWGGYDTERHWRILAALDAVVEQSGASHAQVALAWVRDRPAVSSVIIGARSLAQLDDDLGSTAVTLSNEQLEHLDEASAFELGYPYAFLRRFQPRW